VQWDRYIGEHLLTSITAYRYYYIEAETTVVQPSLILPSNLGIAKQTQMSQELRLTSPVGSMFDYVVGAFYFKQLKSGSIDQKIRLRANGFQQQNHLIFADADNANYALFGEGNFHPTSDLTLIAGARWTKFDVNFRNVGLPRAPGFAVVNLAPGETIQDRVTAEEWSWKLGATWKLSGNDMIYATVSRGIKGPAFNTLATNATGPQRVRPEIATNYEIGFKGSLLDNRVRTSIALFSTTFKDFQAQAVETDPVTGLRTFVLVNAGRIRTRGVEGSLNIYPTDTTSIDASMSYIDAVFQDFPGGQCYAGQTPAQGCVGGVQNLKGARLPANPKWAFSIGGEQIIRFEGAPVEGFVNFNYSWRGNIQWDIFQDPETIEDSVGLLSGAVGIRARDRRYSLSLFAKNLTDKFYTNGLTPGTAIVGFTPIDYRRQVGVKMSYNF
jgi:iron complex outermembrane receptor protein